MMLHKMGWLFQQVLYPQLTWSRYSDEKVIYLTFDDGPISEVTEWVLETLKSYDAKATFFCVGDNIRKHPAIFEQVLADGHRVGNHTYNHVVGWKTHSDQYIANIEQCAALLPTTSKSSPLFRPPHGRITRKQIKKLLPHYEIVMWDVLSGDFLADIGKQNCLNKTIQYTQKGSIVVFHDSLKAEANLRYVLPRYLEHYKSLGYNFQIL
ncbi:MAG: polysaccharide deacetylase family protein [Flammeovirgaceae bacterium]